MQHLRDNEGVLEASNNGTDWETVVLGEGGGGPLTNPFTLGAIQVRSSGSILELSRDAGSTWQRVWDTGANSLSLLDKVFSPPIIVTDDQPGTWSLTIGTISLWWEPTAEALWLIYWRAQDEWYRIPLTPNGRIAALTDTVTLGSGGTVQLQGGENPFGISNDGGISFKHPIFSGDDITCEGEFYPPLIENNTEPTGQNGVLLWHDTLNSKFYLLYRDDNDINHKVELV